jgi:putative ABC transport system permease protein
VNVVRDVFRRKGRSILTITGIAIGVFALVVLGAVAENQNRYVDTLKGFYAGYVIVTEAEGANFSGMASGSRPLSMTQIEEIAAYPGVQAVYPQSSMLLDAEYLSVIPPMVLSIAPGSERHQPWTVAEGRAVRGDERGVALAGSDLAKQMSLSVGDGIDVRGQSFEVVGVLERSYVNLVDASVYLPLAQAQQLYYDSLPEAFRANVHPSELVVQAEVYADEGVDPDELASELGREIEGIKATGPTEMGKTVSGLIALINAIVWSVAALALIVCVLSIINTMTMAVTERTREIGIKRALGASRWRVGRDVILEAAVMGSIGGAAGLALGSSVAAGLNSAMVQATGTSVLLVTARLALGALAFAVVLGILGGLWPARHAARLEPAAALTYE